MKTMRSKQKSLYVSWEIGGALMNRSDLLQAARDVAVAQKEFQDRLFVLESLLEAVEEEAT